MTANLTLSVLYPNGRRQTLRFDNIDELRSVTASAVRVAQKVQVTIPQLMDGRSIVIGKVFIFKKGEGWTTTNIGHSPRG